MISVIIDKKNIVENKITVTESGDINHLKNVFRIKCGDMIRAVDGEFEYIVSIKNIDKKSIECEIIKKNNDKFTTKTQIDIGICILKNDKMDLCIQKLTEIGINKIIPLRSKRGVVKLKEKKDKWHKIVNETMKQCQAVKPTEIDDIKNIENINFNEYDLIIIPYECEKENTLKNLLKNVKDIKKVLYIIGPEGGFDTSEIDFLMSKNAKIITLGNRILRAETASIVVGGILINEFE